METPHAALHHLANFFVPHFSMRSSGHREVDYISAVSELGGGLQLAWVQPGVSHLSIHVTLRFEEDSLAILTHKTLSGLQALVLSVHGTSQSRF